MTNPEKNLPPELASLEAKLAELKPSPGRLDRERLMYELGQAHATPNAGSATFSWKWTLGLTLTSNIVVALVMFLILQPDNQTKPSQATGLTAEKMEATQPIEPSQTTEPVKPASKPSEPEQPTDSHGQWGRTIARWLGIPTYEPVKIPSARSVYLDTDSELLAHTPYVRLLANRTRSPRTAITIEEEKPVPPRPPLRRDELMKQYLDGEWN